MIDESDRRRRGLSDRIRDARPAIRKHMNVFVEGERAGSTHRCRRARRFMC